MNDFLAWLAPIVSTLIVCAGQLILNSRFKRADEKRDCARMETKQKLQIAQEWRDSIISHMNNQDHKIDTILEAQCSQMRSDIIHRAHRYMDDLGCASLEEKKAFWDEYTKYQEMCKISKTENGFINDMVKRVMSLPNRA